MRPTALLDASVLAPSLIRNLLMHLASAGLIAAHWTHTIHEDESRARCGPISVDGSVPVGIPGRQAVTTLQLIVQRQLPRYNALPAASVATRTAAPLLFSGRVMV